MFIPDPDLLKISRELEDTMRLTQGGALELDGSRESVVKGVMVAVNQLLQDPAFEVAGFALHHWGYHDIAVRKLTD